MIRLLVILLLQLFCRLAFIGGNKLISLRGGDVVQRLPRGLTSSWNIWNYDIHSNQLDKVENDNDLNNEVGSSWINPTTYDSLFLPSDLPNPKIAPALGLVMANGSPRYIMPSMIMTLETPDKIWRNRGLNSLPRASAWIDLFGPFVGELCNYRISYYGQYTPNVRFLEDQDGYSGWIKLLRINKNARPSQDIASNSFEFEDLLIQFKENLKTMPTLNPLCQEGYHFVDIPLFNSVDNEKLARFSPPLQMKAFLTDFDDPMRLLEFEDASMMDLEPCGELSCKVEKVSAGSESKFLPEVQYLFALTCTVSVFISDRMTRLD